MRRLALLLSLIAAPAFSMDVEIHQPHHFDILGPNSALECRYVSDESFGFLLERGNGEKIRVSVITNGRNEGSVSAFEVGIRAHAATGLHLYLFERSGKFGKYVEFELRNQVEPLLNYRFPAMFMQVSALYEAGKDGAEQENLYPDASKRLACRIP